MAKGKNKETEISILFEERVGTCNIAMCLDKRNPARAEKDSYPLAVRFTIYDSRYYYRLGEKYTATELAKIRKSVANREKSYGNETSFESKVRLQEVFTSMIRTVTNVNETGILTLERIKTALTGRCENNSFISVWEGIINIKRQDDKAGTAEVYETALKNFKEITKVSYSDGFSIDVAVIQKWVEGMNDRGFASATQGIYLRTCRMVINRCIGDGYMMPKAYMFGKSSNKIKIPVGASRKGWYLNVSQMMELYNHLMLRDVEFPIHNTRSKENPKNTVKSEASIDLIYQSLAMFLMQYFCCGCNLYDLALLRYNRFYFDCNKTAFQFIRHKSENETLDGEGMEVIVPIIDPMLEILKNYGAEPVMNGLVFPFLMGDAYGCDGQAQRDRIHQENKNISHRLKKFADKIGWTINLTGTYARHSFATNLHAAKVPMEYVSDAMGHSLGNRGQITMRYISPYTIEERKQFNNKLLGIEDESQSSNVLSSNKVKQNILGKMEEYSEEDLKEALLMLKKKELLKLEEELKAM